MNIFIRKMWLLPFISFNLCFMFIVVSIMLAFIYREHFFSVLFFVSITYFWYYQGGKSYHIYLKNKK